MKCPECGEELPQRSEVRGRPRKYCSDRCRTRGMRTRQQNAKWVPAIEGSLHMQPPASHSEQLDSTVLEAASIAASFRRLSIEESNPILAAGCECAYVAITAALNSNFPGWDS